jgi:hypothetical protein
VLPRVKEQWPQVGRYGSRRRASATKAAAGGLQDQGGEQMISIESVKESLIRRLCNHESMPDQAIKDWHLTRARALVRKPGDLA